MLWPSQLLGQRISYVVLSRNLAYLHISSFDDLPNEMESPNLAKWLGAMESEMQSMYDNQVWTLVDPPQGAKIIECKWIFKEKADNIC